MKREILFRGRTIKTRFGGGKWIEGFYVMSCAGRAEMEPAIITGTEKGCFMTEFVDPATVGQFTGLTDKNGKKIFEGDIVKTHYANAVKSDFVETVVFHNGRFCANSKISETGQWWTSLADGVPHVSFDKSVYMESCEVTGNIHDTPELAKEESE